MQFLNRLCRRISESTLGLEITVTGVSMFPAFSEGDRAIVEPRLYRGDNPRRLDIVVVRPPGEHREDIKRIVGLPNELVEIRDGTLQIDGEVLAESYISEPMPREWLHAWGTGDAEYVILGDNRGALGITDSRAYGPVRRDALVGPVTRRLK